MHFGMLLQILERYVNVVHLQSRTPNQMIAMLGQNELPENEHADKHLLERVVEWQCQEVVEAISRKLSVSSGEAAARFHELKLFLLVSSRRVDEVSKKYRPTHAIDDTWHEFLLFTRAYREFCLGVLGVFVDHTPGLAIDAANWSELVTDAARVVDVVPSSWVRSSQADCVSCFGQQHPDDADCSNDKAPSDVTVVLSNAAFVEGIAERPRV